MFEEKIDPIKGLDELSGKKPATQAIQPNKEHFDSLMSAEAETKPAPAASTTAVAEAATRPTPMEEVKRLNSRVEAIAKASPEEIRFKADQIIAEIDEINKKYSNVPEARIAPSYNALLKNRLSHIDDTLKIALSKAGLEYQPPIPPTGNVNPIEKFLGYLTHGQHQLEHLGKAISQIQAQGAEMSPADMLLIQVKVNQIQQELEFVTNVLNKALESTKTLMNVQV